MPRVPRFDIELGAFVEEISTDLARFECAAQTGCKAAEIWIEHEVPLGDGYADILVEPPTGPAFFVENKLEYPPEDVVARIRGKYGVSGPAVERAERLAIVLDRAAIDGWPQVEAALRASTVRGLQLDVWDVADLPGRTGARPSTASSPTFPPAARCSGTSAPGSSRGCTASKGWSRPRCWSRASTTTSSC